MAGGGAALRPPPLPRRGPVPSYGNGGVPFAGMSHRGSLLCLPSGIHGWDAPATVDVASLERVLAESDGIEVLLVGTGRDLVPLSAEVRGALREQGIVAEPMSTGAAVRTFNVLLAEARAVAAALVAVD